MKKLVSILIAVAIVAFASGCTTAVQHGNIVSVTSRTFGVHITSVSTSSGSPEVDLGFASQTVQFTPTSTNGPIYAPSYANTFKIGQASVPFTFDVDETIASGNYQTGNGTNVSSVPVVPK